MPDETPEKTEAPALMTLTDFIEKYQRVISVAGVLVALALFWKNIRTEESTPYISYLCLLATVPLLLEVNKGYDYDKSSWNVILFMQAFNGIVLFTIYYLVVSYPNHLERIVFAAFFFALFLGFGALQGKLLAALRKRDYAKRVVSIKDMQLKKMNVDTINAIAAIEYKYAVKNIRLAEVVLLILGLLMILLVMVPIETFIHATFDQILDRTPTIEAPAIPPPSPVPPLPPA